MSIIQNAIRIREKGKKPIFLASTHRHDFQVHAFSNGAYIFVDGGTDYFRRGHSGKPPTGSRVDDFSLKEGDHFLKIKARLLWGTLGKDGKGPLTYKPLSSFSKAHLRAILKNCEVGDRVKKVITSLLAKKKQKTI